MLQKGTARLRRAALSGDRSYTKLIGLLKSETVHFVKSLKLVSVM